MDIKRLKIITKSKRVKQSSKGIEDRFNSLLENNPDSICSLDLQGKFTSVNPATERITGYSAEEILNHSLKSFITKENIMKVLRYFERTAQGESQNYEVTITHKEGHRIELSVKNVPIIVRNKIVGVYIIAKDITQRKQMEEQLRESESNYRFIAKNMSDLIIVLDETGVVQYASPSHKRVLGFSPTVYEGRMVFDLVHPEDISFVQNIYEKMIVTKLPHLVELRYKHSNGDWIAVEANGMPVIGGNGEVINVVVVAREITKRRQAEEALQESEKQLRTLINALPDGAFLKDGEGRWLEANHAGLHLFQLGNAPYKGKRDTELAIYSQVAGEAFLNCQRSDEEAWKAQRMIQLEEVIPQPDGESRTFDVIKVPTFYPDGKRKGIVVIGRDITERKKTEEIIRKTDKLAVIGELAAGIAHEIRNPLTSLKGFTQLLQKSQDEKNVHYFDVMLSELERINLIVSEFLLLAKPHLLDFEMKDLSVILQNVVTLMGSEANKSNVQILTEITSNIPLIKCEENQLKQVFINVLKNAMEAMPGGGEILIKIQMEENNKVVIQFIDHGCGMSEERILKLGEPFYTTKEKGTGLGLTVSYKIVENHYGKINIKSQINKGTIVEIVLPA